MENVHQNIAFIDFLRVAVDRTVAQSHESTVNDRSILYILYIPVNSSYRVYPVYPCEFLLTARFLQWSDKLR
jgi:hypothetical protein